MPAGAQLGALHGGFKLAMQTLDIFRASVAGAAGAAVAACSCACSALLLQASKSAPQRSVVEFKAIGVRAKKRLPYALHVKP